MVLKGNTEATMTYSIKDKIRHYPIQIIINVLS